MKSGSVLYCKPNNTQTMTYLISHCHTNPVILVSYSVQREAQILCLQSCKLNFHSIKNDTSSSLHPILSYLHSWQNKSDLKSKAIFQQSIADRKGGQKGKWHKTPATSSKFYKLQ